MTEEEMKKRWESLTRIGLDISNFSKTVQCDCINPEYLKLHDLKIDLESYKSIEKNINIPEKYRNFCFEMYKIPLVQNVKDLLMKKYFFDEKMKMKKNGFLFFSQTPGTGKTLLALSILHSMSVEFKMSAKYINTVIFFQELKRLYNKDKETMMFNEIELLDELARVDILVLDDLGSEKATDWVREKLYYIFESRNFYNKITLITSNDSVDLLANKIGNKIVSRLLENLGVIEFANIEDWRLKGK